MGMNIVPPPITITGGFIHPAVIRAREKAYMDLPMENWWGNGPIPKSYWTDAEWYQWALRVEQEDSIPRRPIPPKCRVVKEGGLGW